MPVIERYLFEATFWIYALGAMLFLLYTVTEKKRLVSVAIFLAGAGLVIHTSGLVLRAVNIGRMPFANMYEFTIFFTWGLVLLYLFSHRKQPIPLLGTVVMPVAVALMAGAGMMNGAARPLMPALQSHWMQAHVATAVLAYGAFGVSFGVGVLYLIRESQSVPVATSASATGQGQPVLPALETLDTMLYRTIAFGFLFLTLVLITGAVWAEQVWGAWWSWDPKETWALITWMVYAVFLHGRFTRGWQGRRTAWLAVVGFAAVMFTLFGVTWLMPGLHSYN
ncbi:c-type cytochrome biogenesis protein CcsB [Desulforamulus aquiferis]|uniref:Heme exporter protein C n=2 Tax=Desulforamulus aquiferis TaxID=1397668 RepID=A0AAW7ZF85_9FIRM|nr:c-type cytochrome biogenesis protein CcsB [Desulforamulus aquiferis]